MKNEYFRGLLATSFNYWLQPATKCLVLSFTFYKYMGYFILWTIWFYDIMKLLIWGMWGLCPGRWCDVTTDLWPPAPDHWPPVTELLKLNETAGIHCFALPRICIGTMCTVTWNCGLSVIYLLLVIRREHGTLVTSLGTQPRIHSIPCLVTVSTTTTALSYS